MNVFIQIAIPSNLFLDFFPYTFFSGFDSLLYNFVNIFLLLIEVCLLMLSPIINVFVCEMFPPDCQSSDAYQEILSRCHGRKHCAVKASTRVFGEPCLPGTYKYLQVVYSCGKLHAYSCFVFSALLLWGEKDI